MCHPFPNNVKIKRGSKRRHKVHRATKKDSKEQTGSKRTSVCKCGALGCGCAPIPGEETAYKREDVPTSPQPIDLAIGWPFGYGPSFGWGLGIG